MEKKEKLKVLWWANAPYVGTGYGVGTKGVVERIKDRYEIRLLCFYGLQGKALLLNDLVHYPQLMTPIGDWEAKQICVNEKPHLMVTLFDIWIAELAERDSGREFFRDIHEHWVPWIPVDHDPSPIGINNQARKAYHPVTMSKFGKRALAEQNIESTLIPLGTDTSVFRPTEDKVADVNWVLNHSVPMKREKAVQWNTDDFIIGINAAPKDPVRKNFVGMFDAFKIFFEQNPDARKDARMYLHTWRTFPQSWPLTLLAEERDIVEYCRVTNEFYMYTGYSEDKMAQVTRSWDVLFNLATREGFGIPIIEACACGVPPIVTNFTSMPELAEGHGWIVDGYVGPSTLTNLLSYGMDADVFEAAEAIEEAYNSPDKVKEYSAKARKFSYDYDWTVIAELWSLLFDKLGEDILDRPLGERRIR